MNTVSLPTDEDLDQAAERRYNQRRDQALAKDGTQRIPTWEELCDAERLDQRDRMRAAVAAGPRVAEALGMRTYSRIVSIPEPGNIVMYQGWPAIITATNAHPPLQAQLALPPLTDELCVHLHVMSALGPYPAYGVGYSTDGWQYPHDITEARQREQEKNDAQEARRAAGISGRPA